MNKEIYISVSITDYGNGTVRCEMLQSVDDGELQVTKLTKAHAQKLIWELVLAGGTRTVRVNSRDSSIIVQDAYIFLQN